MTSGGSLIKGNISLKLASSAGPTCAPLNALITDFLKLPISIFKLAALGLNPR
jgi:hypothetical protein